MMECEMPRASRAADPHAKTDTESVDEFLARGGTIRIVTDYPDPDGRVLPRGARGRPQPDPQPAADVSNKSAGGD